MYYKSICLGEIEHVHHIGVTSYLGYIELRITRCIFAISLDFEIARLTCIQYVHWSKFAIDQNAVNSSKIYIFII